ncbi:hypothetical protein [Pontibacter rugosus]|uniref:SWFGD domain-containing protein n=1 Tax=Pontibacter rugosus TaxID=1745966 RepID=A0ABW3SVN2_9BACT
MERNNRNSRDDYRNDRNRIPEREERRSTDPDQYRGAYRLDTNSDHRNETTWNGFGSSDRNNNRGEEAYRDNNTYRTHHDRGYDHDNYSMNSRWRNSGNSNAGNSYNDQSSRYSGGNNRDSNEQYRSSSGGYRSNYSGGNSQQHRSVHDRIQDRDPYGSGNFNADYRRDTYGNGNGNNYGNEAGSLSYGYDGSSNYDPDWNRHYNPLSGERTSYHGNYTSRRPDNEQYKQNSSNRRNWNDNDRY